MNKIYQRIDWENYPSSATPLNEDNLNKMDYAIDKLDDRIVTHETTKLNTATGNTLVKNVTFNEKTGVFTIEKLSGSKITINTALEKISTNFHFNPTTQKLVLTLIDGTVQEIDLSALITQYEFSESDTITFEIDASGKVKANILNGSITGEKLEPNYLANVTLQAKNAKTSADNAKTSEKLAYQYAEEAKESASQTAKSDAKNITYDNTESGLSATNVKDALDEVAQGSVSAIAIDTTITDSTNAPLIYGKFKGYTEQDGEPTPDNPVEINVLAKDGVIEVKTTGKNMLNNTASSKTLYGITVTVNDNKSITLNGTATQDFITKIGEFNDNDDNYLLSGCPSGGSTSSYYLVASCRDENNTWKQDNADIGSGKELSNDYAKRIIQIGVKSGATVPNLTFYPMIRKAEIEDATYEPYTETTAAIPTDAPLYEGDYLEVYADGSGKVVKKMGSVVLDGSDDETWAYQIVSDGKANTFTIKGLNASKELWNKKVGQYCSHFPVSIAGYSEYSCFSFNSYGTLVIQYAILTDVATWKSWLQSNPVTVVYELAEPTETPLTAEQVAQFKQLYTFEPVTNVLCDGEVEIQYYKNTTSGVAVGTVHRMANDEKSIYDGDGNVITETYAKQTDLEKVIDGTTTVAKATSATTATKATQDADGNNIVNTYAKKSSVLSTLTECEASTKDTDIASASALTELNDSLALQTATVNVSDTISGATGTFKVYKFGKVCTVVWSNINGLNHASWASNSMIAYLPNGFRPKVEVSKDPLCGGGYAIIPGKLVFHTGGAIQVTSPNAITDITNGNITYITS